MWPIFSKKPTLPFGPNNRTLNPVPTSGHGHSRSHASKYSPTLKKVNVAIGLFLVIPFRRLSHQKPPKPFLRAQSGCDFLKSACKNYDQITGNSSIIAIKVKMASIAMPGNVDVVSHPSQSPSTGSEPICENASKSASITKIREERKHDSRQRPNARNPYPVAT